MDPEGRQESLPEGSLAGIGFSGWVCIITNIQRFWEYSIYTCSKLDGFSQFGEVSPQHDLRFDYHRNKFDLVVGLFPIQKASFWGVESIVDFRACTALFLPGPYRGLFSDGKNADTEWFQPGGNGPALVSRFGDTLFSSSLV